jgi:hypothetical protein
MSPQLPSFLRRRLRLSEARRELLAGRPEAALGPLEDPALADLEEARVLRDRVLDLLGREAARRHPDRPEEAARLLDLVERRDPRRGRAWRRRLEAGASEGAVSASGLRPAAEAGLVRAMRELLGELREGEEPAGEPPPGTGDELPGTRG